MRVGPVRWVRTVARPASSSSSSSSPLAPTVAKAEAEGARILAVGHPLLRTVAAPVLPQDYGSPRLTQLVRDMHALMDRHDALGLAAPQLGVPLQVIAYQYLERWMTPATAEDDAARGIVPVPRTFLVNPRVKAVGPERTLDYEACLSIDQLCALVRRARHVQVTAHDLDGRPVAFRASNYLARVLQHEADHLRGILFVDRMLTRSLRTVDQIGAPLPDPLDNLPPDGR
jgi:peptide deformylase